MQELDKNKIYDLSELTSEELKEVLNWLKKNDEDWDNCPFEEMIKYQKTDRLVFNTHNWEWSNTVESTHNAKELFYTLENIQVDCSELSDEQIKEMCKVYESRGFKKWKDLDAFKIEGSFTYLKIDWENEFYITGGNDNFTTITYGKFMELFGDTNYLVETTDEVCLFSSREKESEKRTLKLKKTLKYLLKKDIILTPKQYKKLWKKF